MPDTRRRYWQMCRSAVSYCFVRWQRVADTTTKISCLLKPYKRIIITFSVTFPGKTVKEASPITEMLLRYAQCIIYLVHIGKSIRDDLKSICSPCSFAAGGVRTVVSSPSARRSKELHLANEELSSKSSVQSETLTLRVQCASLINNRDTSSRERHIQNS